MRAKSLWFDGSHIREGSPERAVSAVRPRRDLSGLNGAVDPWMDGGDPMTLALNGLCIVSCPVFCASKKWHSEFSQWDSQHSYGRIEAGR